MAQELEKEKVEVKKENVFRPVETPLYKKIKKYIPDIIEWTREGVTQKDIANALQINPSTLYDFKLKYPEFEEAFVTGNDLLFDDIEASLYKSARWSQVKETWYDSDGEISKQFVKEIPPNQRSIEYALNNRRPNTWRADTKNIDLSINEALKEKLSNLTVQDISAIANLNIDEVLNENEESVERNNIDE